MTSTFCFSHSKKTSITFSLGEEKGNLTFILHLKINNRTMKCVFFPFVCLELWGNNITKARLPASLKCHRNTDWNI